jgi:site-specific DNA recombinase
VIKNREVRVTNRETVKPVGIWVRVSTEDQAQGESPDHHERRGRMYAESKGWEVVRVYDLCGVSGKTVMEHPETRAMLEDVATGRIKGLIFSKIARLARNTRELLEFAEYFESHRADLVSLAESIDTSTPAGRFFYTLIAAMAQWEREEIADRVKASVVVRAKMGKSLGGAAPFGYRWDNNRLVADPAEAPVRRHLFELFAEHKRLKTTAALLNKAGYRTRNGSLFSDSTVRRLLEDPIAKGVRRSNYTKSTGQKKHWTVKSPEEWVLTPVESIVSEELWELCNAELNGRSNGRKPAKKAVHLFTGVAFCECGGKMAVPSNSPKYTCSKCRNKIATGDLELVFREQLHGFFQSDEEVSAYLSQADEEVAGKRILIESLNAELVRVKAEMDKVYRLYLDGTISSQSFGERYRPLEERVTQLSNELPRLQGEVDFMAVQNLSGQEIVAQARDLYGRWQKLDFVEKREIVESIVERISVGEDSVSIELYYSPGTPTTVIDRQRNSRDSWPLPA